MIQIKKSMGAVIVSALLVSATPANAARLRILQGDVLVNDGAGFARAVDGAEIAPGQQLLSGPQTQSELVYPDGSVVQLPPGVTAIASDMPILTVVESTPSEASLFGPQGVSTTNLVLGVVGVAGLTAGIAAIAGSGGGASSPASP